MHTKPSALLLIASGCQHCPSVLQSLSELIKEGELSSLEVVNISTAPERARELNVRSVPWVKLGEYELVGMKTKGELKQWIDKSAQDTNMGIVFEEMMTSGNLDKVEARIQAEPESFEGLLDIMTRKDASLSARIGVGAIMESLAGSDILIKQIPALGELSQHKNPQVRNDACYYLGLSHHISAEPFLQARLEDENSDVRESADDALQDINS